MRARSGWVLKRGKLRLRAGSRLHRLSMIFSNPKLPELRDYYEPWTYEYDTLISAPLGEHTPVARPKSLISGKPMKIEWSANWDDDLAGGPELAPEDPVLKKVKAEVGDLSSITRVVKLVAFVASTPDFTGQPHVANGASELVGKVFGDIGQHARSAVGVPVLPLDAPVEVELVVEVS